MCYYLLGDLLGGSKDPIFGHIKTCPTIGADEQDLNKLISTLPHAPFDKVDVLKVINRRENDDCDKRHVKGLSLYCRKRL